MKFFHVITGLAAAAALSACGDAPQGNAPTPVQSASTAIAAEGRPYQIDETEVWSVPDPVSGRKYEAYVALPKSYATSPERRYPVLYVTDAPYAFPLIRAISRRVGDEEQGLEDFIIVGLSYAEGDGPKYSRNRDYTPVPTTNAEAAKTGPYGEAEGYRVYIRDQVIPFIEGKYRTEPGRRAYMGHSFGALLGLHTMFTEPAMFSTYILGSPSLWYANRNMMKVEEAYAAKAKDLPADVFMYIGSYEAVRMGDRRYNQDFDMVADMRTFEQRLKSRNYPSFRVASVVLEEEDHMSVFPPGLTRGLKRFFPPEPRA